MTVLVVRVSFHLKCFFNVYYTEGKDKMIIFTFFIHSQSH